MAVTARQIAHELGLSEATVSIALHGRPGISEKTRALVQATASRMGYVPRRSRTGEKDSAASTPSPAESPSIAIIVSDRFTYFGNEFYSEVQSGIMVALKNSGYQALLVSLDLAHLEPDWAVRQLPASCVGLIVFATQMRASEMDLIANTTLPTVWLDNPWAPANADSVVVRNRLGARQATRYLHDKYGELPGHIRGDHYLPNFDERRLGYQSAVRELGGDPTTLGEFVLSSDVDQAVRELEKMLLDGFRPARCYLADNDFIAIGAVRALQRSGLRVPEDVAVVGFDDIRMASLMEPTLTTIRVPKHELGFFAAQRLMTLLDGRCTSEALAPASIALNTQLVIRASA